MASTPLHSVRLASSGAAHGSRLLGVLLDWPRLRLARVRRVDAPEPGVFPPARPGQPRAHPSVRHLPLVPALSPVGRSSVAPLPRPWAITAGGTHKGGERQD